LLGFVGGFVGRWDLMEEIIEIRDFEKKRGRL